MTLTVRRNYNYTISVIDSASREIVFRDINGTDLEFLDFLLKDREEGGKEIDFDSIILILSRLCAKKANFKSLTQRTIIGIFNAVKENILCNYMSKHEWLRRCYEIQNGSFAGLLEMEKVPMSKFVAMIQVHHQAIETMNKPTT